MAACETCWTEASRQVFFAGGSVVDRYKEQLALHPDGHGDEATP
jgi:hypothetical protein